MTKAYLSLGTNLGDKKMNLSQAICRIKTKAGEITRQSGVYLSEPWGFSSDDLFLNQVVEIETCLPAIDLLKALLLIEKEMGRVRDKKGVYHSRIIDIDLLFFGNEIINNSQLILPHPHISKRRFVLVPLSEIVPGFIHPVSGLTIQQLLSACPDELMVRLDHS